MRLTDFIVANMEPILVEWEGFARSIWPGEATAQVQEVRDDAEHILRETVRDMESDQSDRERAEKSQGRAPADQGYRLTRASSLHGVGRAVSGFDLAAMIAEYRALRASVLRLWRASLPTPDLHDIDDLTRFDESIDQSLAEAVRSFAERVEHDRAALLAQEQACRREADDANRAKDVFLATLSHEMRTPLSTIVAWLSILQSEQANEESLREGLSVIKRNTEAQVHLIDDVLDVSRIVSGKLRVEMRPCDLSEVVNAALSVARPAAEAKGISLTVDFDPAAGSAVCDAGRIQQVVWNLASNAVKFTPKGGRIDVSVKREQSSIQLQVKDNGRGMSADLLPQVFDRFRQADSGTRRTVGGLGLGLSIVKYIAEAHGGTIEADSSGEGSGSTFTVRLPVPAVRIAEDFTNEELVQNVAERRPEGAPSLGHSLPPVRLDGLRVLLVDDDADARRVLVMVLEHVGAIVTPASSAHDAVEMLPAAQPDVLISDVGMPDQDGFDLIRQVRELGHDEKQLPAVALTAFVHQDHVRSVLASGFQVHVPKPVDPHDLTFVIATLVGRT